MKRSLRTPNLRHTSGTVLLTALIVLAVFAPLPFAPAERFTADAAQEAPDAATPVAVSETPAPTPTEIPLSTEEPGQTATPTPLPVQPATSTPTATMTPTPSPTSVVRPAASNPACALTLSVGVIAQRIRVNCSGFTSGARVNISWQGIGTLKTLSISGSGAATDTFLVPTIAPGQWRVRAADGKGVSIRMDFTVQPPSISFTPAIAVNGASIALRIRGFQAKEQVAIRWYSLTGSSFSKLKTVTLSTSGSTDLTLLVPQNAGLGGHKLEAAGLTSGLLASSSLTVIKPGQTRYLDQGTPGCKRVAIIFNIGIGSTFHTGILDTLKRLDVPATMFPMGWWADKYPAIALRLATDGFVIGSHGHAAHELTTQSNSRVTADIKASTKAITKATGAPPGPWFTPYAAAIDTRVKQLIAEQGYVPVGWRVSANDYAITATESAVYSRVVDNVYDGAIVEFHIDGPATRTSTGRALPRIISTLRSRGYTFVTIPQMALRCSSAANGALQFASGATYTLLSSEVSAVLPATTRRTSYRYQVVRSRYAN